MNALVNHDPTFGGGGHRLLRAVRPERTFPGSVDTVGKHSTQVTPCDNLTAKPSARYREAVAKQRAVLSKESKEILSAALSLLGRKGGRAPAESLTPERRRKIARMGSAATKALWARKNASKDRTKAP